MSVDATALASVLGITAEYKDLRGGAVQYLPQHIALFAQGATASNASYNTTKWKATSAAAGGAKYGFGSPIHLALQKLMPDNGDGVGTVTVTVFPLKDHGSGVAAVGDVTPAGTATKTVTAWVRCGGVLSEAFTIPVGAVALATLLTEMAAACNAVPGFPAVVTNNADTELVATLKWKGATGNGAVLELIESEPSGLTYTITQPTGGATNPDVTTCLDQIGNVWVTMAINQMEIADTTTLGLYSTFGEGRWGALVRKPLVVFTGDTQDTVTAASTIPDARKTDRTNSVVTAPGSVEFPFVVAARHVARIAVVANNNPPTDYCAQALTQLVPGDDSVQWNYPQQDQAVKAGVSTSEVVDSEIRILDVVTMYHPTGETQPAYRHVVDIVKLQNIIFNISLEFSKKEWASAPLIPDDQPTTNPNARKPKSAKTALGAIVDNLGLEAIISNPKAAKKSIVCNIDTQNPKRLNMELVVQLAGNTKIKDVRLGFGFFFGQAALAA